MLTCVVYVIALWCPEGQCGPVTLLMTADVLEGFRIDSELLGL